MPARRRVGPEDRMNARQAGNCGSAELWRIRLANEPVPGKKLDWPIHFTLSPHAERGDLDRGAEGKLGAFVGISNVQTDLGRAGFIVVDNHHRLAGESA